MKEKMIRCLKVEPGKVPEECTLENYLAALQETVGGLIELLDMEELGNGLYVTILCNEEQRLGHSDVTTTLNIYSHVLERANREAANTIDALIFKQSANL